MNKYHYSPKLEEWSRCVAPTTDKCPFKDDPHGDRTEIAREYDGAVVRDGAARELLITPVVGGVYAVFPDSGDARTYTDKGDLIAAKDREAYLQKAALPKLRAAATDANATPQDRALAKLMTEQTTSKDGQEFKQWVLPALVFKDTSDEPVVVRRTAPAPTALPTPPVTPAVVSPQQSAKAVARTAKKARRSKVVRHCRTAVKLGKAYKRSMNKAVGGKSSSKSGGMDGFFFWFLELFDVK